MPDLEVYFATNRRYRQRDNGPAFENVPHDRKPDEFRVGKAVVRRDGDDYHADRSRIQVYDERRPKQDRDVEALLNQADLPPEVARREARRRLTATPSGRQRLGSALLFPELRKRMADDQCDLIVYIHGFANTFEDALERAAQLKAEYLIDGREPHVMCFSWPSNGDLFPPTEYHDDRDDAEYSGKAIARLFLKLTRFLRENPERCERRMHIVAHSMGNWALRHAARQIADSTESRAFSGLFEHTFLMAADVDDDALEDPQRLQPMTALSKAVHVYHSINDNALRVSDWTKGNGARLGVRGPRRITELPDNVVAVDCQHVDRTELFHGAHQYYRLRSEVIGDVRQVLSGTPPDEVTRREPVSERRYRIPER